MCEGPEARSSRAHPRDNESPKWLEHSLPENAAKEAEARLGTVLLRYLHFILAQWEATKWTACKRKTRSSFLVKGAL